MSTTTTNMGLTKPALGADSGSWDDSLNASLDRLDIHTHAAGLGVPIPTAGILLNADLTFGGYAATNLKATAFAVQTASPALARSFWVKTSDGELYWRTGGGTDVKVTSGTSLNLSLVGGITGDYAAASASLYYDDAGQIYRFLEAAPLPNSWSRIGVGDVDLYEHASGIANRVRLSSPAGLAASYGLTFPAALPGSTLLQQVSSSGVMTWSNTVTQAVTFNAATFNGAIDVNAASTVDATITYSVAPTSPDYLFTTEVTFNIGGCAAALPSASAAAYTVNDTSGEAIWTFASGNRIAIPAGMLRTGDRIKKIGIRADSTAGGSGTLDLKLWQKVSVSVPSQIGSTVSHTNSTTDGTHTLASPETVGAGEQYHFTVRCTAGTPIFYSASITIDRPA